ncbi:membrane-bound lytic murein transglycosylase F, partial [Striga asiatica]
SCTRENNGSTCNSTSPYKLLHRVTESDNKLGVGKPFQGLDPNSLNNVDLYAAQKELYLGKKCQVDDKPKPWQFWMIMLKSGNMDTYAAKCPKNGLKVGPFGPRTQFPCFGKGCMNQPSIYHNYTTLEGNNLLEGSFYGSWDLNADWRREKNISYYSVTWEKELGKGSWVFRHVLRTSVKYPWLMLYLRADATRGLSGGYHYPTRGMLKIIPESPDFRVRFTLNVTAGGGPHSQFYLLDMGGCWKNDGRPCDGDVVSDVTRYSEMILNPSTPSWCRPNDTRLCPPHHTFPNGTQVGRHEKAQFPYEAYHLYCAPGNGAHVEQPSAPCDPYSNPQPQEIVQILPNPVWGDYGYPTTKGNGWIGDARTWELHVGRLSQSLYFY